MPRFRPVPAALYSSSTTFLFKDLYNGTHGFLRQDATRQALERPLLGRVEETEITATSCAAQKSLQLLVLQARHHVDRQDQAGLHTRGGLWEHYLQPRGQSNPRRSTTGHIAVTSYPSYMLRSPRPLPCTLQHLNNHLCVGGCGNQT
jgi:hypothetical protein